MKRLCVMVVALLLAVLMGGCGEQETTPPTGGSGQRLGVGSVSTLALDGKDKTIVKATVAAVLLNKEGKILSCELDEAELPITLKNGMMQDMAAFMTKAEMADDATVDGTLTAASWEDQVEAFCEHVEGMTGAEVAAIAATDGKSEDIRGCDLVITDFIMAVKKASDAAIAKSAAADDDLHLAVTVAKSGDSADNKPQLDIEMAAVTLDDSDRITACVTDTAQAKMAVDGGEFVHESGVIVSKRAAGDGYHMKEASPIKKEWYEQADAFDAYAVGKTADLLAKTPVAADGKTDAVSGCTIAVSGMLKNAVKAAQD